MNKELERVYLENELPFIATHPGELIKDELKARSMTQRQLSRKTGIKPSVLSETIKGKRPISLNTAIRLEKGLEIPAKMWMNLQSQYELDKKNIEAKKTVQKTVEVTIPVTDSNLLKELSRKFGWVCTL